jgi:hypothetical protein
VKVREVVSMAIFLKIRAIMDWILCRYQHDHQTKDATGAVFNA